MSKEKNLFYDISTLSDDDYATKKLYWEHYLRIIMEDFFKKEYGNILRSLKNDDDCYLRLLLNWGYYQKTEMSQKLEGQQVRLEYVFDDGGDFDVVHFFPPSNFNNESNKHSFDLNHPFNHEEFQLSGDYSVICEGDIKEISKQLSLFTFLNVQSKISEIKIRSSIEETIEIIFSKICDKHPKFYSLDKKQHIALKKLIGCIYCNVNFLGGGTYADALDYLKTSDDEMSKKYAYKNKVTSTLILSIIALSIHFGEKHFVDHVSSIEEEEEDENGLSQIERIMKSFINEIDEEVLNTLGLNKTSKKSFSLMKLFVYLFLIVGVIIILILLNS